MIDIIMCFVTIFCVVAVTVIIIAAWMAAPSTKD